MMVFSIRSGYSKSGWQSRLSGSEGCLNIWVARGSEAVQGLRLGRERSRVLTLFLVDNINKVREEGGGRVNYIKNGGIL